MSPAELTFVCVYNETFYPLAGRDGLRDEVLRGLDCDGVAILYHARRVLVELQQLSNIGATVVHGDVDRRAVKLDLAI